MNFREAPPEDDYSLDLTPMIDIIFQLIIFFMVSTTFSQMQGAGTGLEVALPRGKAAEDLAAHKNDVIVVITREGQIVYEGKNVALKELRTGLESVLAANREAQLILQADTSVTHGAVVAVLDLAKGLGFTRLAIGTENQD